MFGKGRKQVRLNDAVKHHSIATPILPCSNSLLIRGWFSHGIPHEQKVSYLLCVKKDYISQTDGQNSLIGIILSAQFENLGELVKNLIFPVGVDTFPTELSGRLRHVFSPAGAGPETLTGYLCLGIGTGNRTGRSEGLP